MNFGVLHINKEYKWGCGIEIHSVRKVTAAIKEKTSMLWPSQNFLLYKCCTLI